MSVQVSFCPKCKTYIFGYYCAHCQKDVRDIQYEAENVKDLFEQFGFKF